MIPNYPCLEFKHIIHDFFNQLAREANFHRCLREQRRACTIFERAASSDSQISDE